MREKPVSRTGIYVFYVTQDFMRNRKKVDLYDYKIQLMSYDNFGQSDPEWDYWVNEAYPDLILNTPGRGILMR